MRHLLVSREYPPCPYPPGGIGTYVEQMAHLLAERGETVHVIAQRWPGAPLARETHRGGRLTVHRVSLREPLPHAPADDEQVLRRLHESSAPALAFSWQTARLAEVLLPHARIDVIEGQDYEAPLFHLLEWRMRARQPLAGVPVLVHLHTPTEFLARANDWDTSSFDVARLSQCEEFTIRAADGLLCPSRFLAERARQRYDLSAVTLDVVPYPVGDTVVVKRAPHVWQSGTVLYAGRLEPRKGVSEWVDAAVSVAADASDLHCVLVGDDAVHWGRGGSSMRRELEARVPDAVKGRIVLRRAVSRPALRSYRQRARIAVVPSRFENFPNTCVEAMASGMPVIVSPSGGMIEMVEDGQTGWIADGSDATSLAIALRRALATPPARLERMGYDAAAAIARLCDNTTTIDRHLEIRRRVGSRPLNLREPVIASAAAALASALLQERPTLSTGSLHPSSAATMTPLDVLRAAPRQQIALLRRAASNPHYVVQWLNWHFRRWASRVPRNPMIQP